MKSRKQSQLSLALKAHIEDGHLTLQARIPTRWLKALLALLTALLGSGPLVQWLEAITRLPH
jgi:hypothetical protein